MHIKSDEIKRLELEYDSGIVPPPFSNTYKIRIGFEKAFINTHFEIHYTNRDEITEEEILDEGFSLEGEYKFIGEIPKVWEQPIKSLYSKSKWTNKSLLDESGGIKVMAKDIHGKIVRGIPVNQKDWQFIAQDLIQAIYEIDKKEEPLAIRYRIVDHNGILDSAITLRFAVRKAEFKKHDLDLELDWDATKQLLGKVFLPDYDYALASETAPVHSGTFIDCGDGFWHEFGKGIYNIDDSFDVITKIKEEFMQLNQQ